MIDRIDVVIPARNAHDTIAEVVRPFTEHPAIGRIIVVCNPPSVRTALALKQLQHTRSIYVLQEHSEGKGQAVTRGLEYVITPHVIFCDADLTGFTTHHISSLIIAAVVGDDTMIVGVPDIPENLPGHRLWSFPWVSGERCVPTRLVRPLKLHGYLMETQINLANSHAVHGVEFAPLYGCKSPFRMTSDRLDAMQRDLEWGKLRGIL
jgi:glycosyltransferase involved in cell wall biosynthesis